jgi:hypothetical protein
MSTHEIVVSHAVVYINLQLRNKKRYFMSWKPSCKLNNTLGISGLLDFFHRPVLKRLENTTVRKLDLFPKRRVF